MLKRGRAAAAQPGAGREGVKREKGSILVAELLELVGKAVGTRRGVMPGLGTKGQTLQGWGSAVPGLGAAETGLVLGCGSNITLRWQPAVTRTRSVPMALQ